jgi:hypothetical protein
VRLFPARAAHHGWRSISSFEPLRLLLEAIVRLQPGVLDEAAKALAAGESYALYDVRLTREQLGQLGLQS